MSELRRIRLALGLTQTEMGELFGVKQSAYARWEAEPDKPTARESTEKAKTIYQERKGEPWFDKMDFDTLFNMEQAEKALEAKVAPTIDGQALEVATTLVDELCKDRVVPAKIRWDLISLVAQEFADLRALGKGEEIRDRFQKWVAVARIGLDE